MRLTLIFLLLVFSLVASGQVKLCSWNLCDMGRSKSDAEIAFIANTLSGYNLVALQEIVTGPQGAAAVARLNDALNRKGAKWDFCISEATSGTSQKRERYAFLWKTSEVKKKSDWLDTFYKAEIEREPYFGTFVYKNREFTVVNFHAITKKLQPETEIKYFRYYPVKYPKLQLIFAGDFNCPQQHSVFGPLKKAGFLAAFAGVKTTLRQSCNKGCTASEFDNFFYHKNDVRLLKTGVSPFHESFGDLRDARKISDHLPVWMEFEPI
ncbi:MAG: endonuclease [Chitinophagaceae bacterium]|nr:MAG: endonuclease [Chitinophagaceae bacterium]